MKDRQEDPHHRIAELPLAVNIQLRIYADDINKLRGADTIFDDNIAAWVDD